LTVSSSNQRKSALEPPLRRVLAVDTGARCVRLVLLESYFGRLRVLRQDSVDLQQEGLVATEELQAHLQKTLAAWGRPPIALALPQSIAVSQLVDLPPVPDQEARDLIAAETVKLAGVSESAMVYDFVRVPPQVEGRQSYWVSFCQEVEIQNRITQLGLDREDFREITTAANALLTAWLVVPGRARNVVLVHAGAQGTTLVIVRDGVGVFATSFPMGGDFLTRAVARLRRCSHEAAEAVKVSTDLFEGPQAVPGLTEIVDGWAAELKRQIAEWRASNARSNDATEFEMVATGGAFEQPGLQTHLANKCGLKFQHWPTHDAPEAMMPAMGFEIALGTALQALGHGPQPASLVPATRKEGWQRRLGRQRLEFANAAVLVLCFLMLAYGIWKKTSLIRHKKDLQAKVVAGLEVVQANNSVLTDLVQNYDTLRPLLESEQNTVDTLQALAALQQARSNRAAWFVLLADQQTYFSYPATQAGTNAPALPLAELEAGPRQRQRDSTNVSPARPGLIAELSIPGTADDARSTLGTIVNTLKKSPDFARVDLLSEDLRRSLADPKVLVRDRHYALTLDFATTEFQTSAARRLRMLAPGRAVTLPARSTPGTRAPGTPEDVDRIGPNP
jgi:Tfp pilus assembly PilM family ATPase